MQEVCDTCHVGYAVTPDNAKLALFISYPPANHVITTCGCGATEIIYLGGKTIVQLMKSGKFNITLNDEPTAERREAANDTWGNARGKAAGNDLPHPPRAWLRQLHDDLRTFGNGS
jgi:hypothetical protein